MAKTKSLKSLALSPLSGFRHIAASVPEWEGVTVILREPSAEAWLRWQDIFKGVDGDALSVAERARQNIQADVTLFIDVLCDEQHNPVFSLEDVASIEMIYGPIHSRLLKQALDLITGTNDIKKK